MTRISSNWTVFYKRILPAFWLGLLALWTVIMLGIGRSGDALVRDSRMMIVLPIALALVGLVVMRKLLFSCADEVHDLGDALLVRRGGREATIRFQEIESAAASQSSSSGARRMRAPPCEPNDRCYAAPTRR